MTLSEELIERGLVHQYSTESLEDIFSENTKRTLYLGIDPTADSMHVGHLVPYMLLNHLLQAGHKVILLVGGGTALIGDPSGRDTEREFVDIAVVEERRKKLEENVKKIAGGDITFVNNFDWLSKLSLVEFLRDVGKHFTVNSMIKKESVSTRLESESGISFTEFSYALLQSYDYYHLHREYNCDLQIGASDQWGNITSGIDYIRRTTGDEVYGLTIPLLINPSTGKKFGKSEGNAVWLDETKTSPFAFYQFWLNTADENVIAYLKMFTFLSLEEIQTLEEKLKKDPGGREAQKELALTLTTFIHGENVADAVSRAASILFNSDSLESSSKEDTELILAYAPIHYVEHDTEIVELLTNAALATSKREARGFIESGAVSINGEKVTESTYKLTTADKKGTVALLRRGKKNVSVLRFV